MIKITGVKLPYGWMGNMSPFPIQYEGQVWKTTESLFQSLRFSDPSIREEIRLEKSPMSAKFVSKRYKDRMILEPMGDLDVENMRLVIGLKLNQYPDLRRQLVETGDQEIVEDVSRRMSQRNLFWGRGFKDDLWLGTNMLGKIWMEYRKLIEQEYYFLEHCPLSTPELPTIVDGQVA